MRPVTRWATASALLTTALSGLSSTPAHSAPFSLYAPSALVLTVGHGENAAETVPERAVTMSCAPTASGTHPDVRTACAELALLDGDFDTLGPHAGPPVYCTKEYRPVVVTAQGVWRGKHVDYAHTYGNSCLKDAEGASVFAFWPSPFRGHRSSAEPAGTASRPTALAARTAPRRPGTGARRRGRHPGPTSSHRRVSRVQLRGTRRPRHGTS